MCLHGPATLRTDIPEILHVESLRKLSISALTRKKLNQIHVNTNVHLGYTTANVFIQGVTEGREQTSGGCSLCENIPKKPKTPISKVERFGRKWQLKIVDIL